jgi:DNA polymerase
MRFEYSAGAVVHSVRKGERLFLFLVKDDGRLDLPKGKIEKGESAEEAATREIREESGLAVRFDRHFRNGVNYWYTRKGERVKKHVTMFLAEVGSEEKVRISFEHRSYEWLGYVAAMEKLSFKEWKELITKANEYLDKKEEMNRLNREYGKIPNGSSDWSLSKRLVPGEGSLDAKVMFVGQAPGANEDIEGRPFVGTSGKLLDRLIAKAGLRRDSCYITSVVQFFPPRNRAPTRSEIALCRDFLMRQIGIVKPKIIVLLGSLAAKTVLDADRIMKMHGTVIRKGDYAYFLTLHPAAAVRLKKNVPIIEKDFVKLKGLVKDASS